ncbi:hypothetical protein CV102_14855 [Natronococcus pandeyae]|uniref:SHOCT domain-containing protein n=1 Tax=Natronococcus pandeyae TaxID=2055836 RepID=A0A8J8Q3P7_9EURY|nr:SHOCT domain-containing protein [Natronococcus pandeyae]TYL37993.1 hypothetical protein CV102_14855 [Natronococcus pandeyae]
MTKSRDQLRRYAWMLAATGAVFLVGATATAAAQAHGGGGSMGGWGTFGGWMFLWPILLIGLLVLAVFWAGSGGQSARSDDADRALEQIRGRYARGELSNEEFERRRRKLQIRG